MQNGIAEIAVRQASEGDSGERQGRERVVAAEDAVPHPVAPELPEGRPGLPASEIGQEIEDFAGENRAADFARPVLEPRLDVALGSGPKEHIGHVHSRLDRRLKRIPETGIDFHQFQGAVPDVLQKLDLGHALPA